MLHTLGIHQVYTIFHSRLLIFYVLKLSFVIPIVRELVYVSLTHFQMLNIFPGIDNLIIIIQSNFQFKFAFLFNTSNPFPLSHYSQLHHSCSHSQLPQVHSPSASSKEQVSKRWQTEQNKIQQDKTKAIISRLDKAT